MIDIVGIKDDANVLGLEKRRKNDGVFMVPLAHQNSFSPI